MGVEMSLRSGWLAMGVALLAFVLVPSWADSAGPAPLTGAALKKECVRAATALPEVKQAVMYGRGFREYQSVYILTHHLPMPADCVGGFRRLVEAAIWMKDGLDHSRSVKLADQIVYYRNEKGLGVISKDPGGHNGLPVKQVYKCTPGKGKTPVYAFITRSATDANTGRTLKRKVNRIPLKVQAAC